MVNFTFSSSVGWGAKPNLAWLCGLVETPWQGVSTMAGEIGDPVVLGGFPKAGLNAYVGTMARAGYSVAIAFQDEQKERHIKEIIRVKRDEGQK